MLKQFFKSKNKLQTPSIGSNSQIVSQLHALEIEKDILTKTIARLYQNETDLTKIQKDRLLLKYQHQLGVVITRIEKLENASKHPDLGPLGDGLITLMDQKLSQLDQRLYELTSKIQVAQTENDAKKKNRKVNGTEVKSKPIFEKPIEEYANKRSDKFEITTLTSLPKLDPVKQSKYDEMLSQLSSDVITPPPMKPKIYEEQKTEVVEIKEQNIIPVIENKPEPIVQQVPEPVIQQVTKPIVELPEEEDLDDDDDDDLNKIKTKIMETMSKIEQAEVD